MNKKNTTPLEDAVKKSRFVLLAVAVVSLFVNVLMLTVPLYMLQIYGRVLVSRSHETLIYLSVAAVGTLMVMAALDFSRARILVHLSAWLENRLGPEVLPPAISQQLQSQSYGVQALRDVSQVRQFVASPVIFALFDAPWVPVYLLVIYLLHPVLFGIAVIGAVLLFALAVTNELATRKPLKAANEQNVKALRKTAAAARNAEVIEAMGMMPGITQRWLDDNERALQQQMLASRRAGIILAASKLSRLVLQGGHAGHRRLSGHPLRVDPGRHDRRLHHFIARPAAGGAGHRHLEIPAGRPFGLRTPENLYDPGPGAAGRHGPAGPKRTS